MISLRPSAAGVSIYAHKHTHEGKNDTTRQPHTQTQTHRGCTSFPPLLLVTYTGWAEKLLRGERNRNWRSFWCTYWFFGHPESEAARPQGRCVDSAALYFGMGRCIEALVSEGTGCAENRNF